MNLFDTLDNIKETDINSFNHTYRLSLNRRPEDQPDRAT